MIFRFVRRQAHNDLFELRELAGFVGIEGLFLEDFANGVFPSANFDLIGYRVKNSNTF